MNFIEFPNLWNLKIPISPVAFKIFDLNIFWYGMIVAVAFLVAVLLAFKDSKNFGIDAENIIDFTLFVVPVAIIFARLYYVIFNWEQFSDSLLSIINIRTGGLAIYGGVLGSILVAYIYTKVKKINILSFLDFTCVYLVLGQAIGRWGNFVNQEAFGTNTNLPWGMTGNLIKNQLVQLKQSGVNINYLMPVHPTFLYESLWNIFIFIILIIFRKKKKIDGEVFCLYMALYGFGRFWIEGLRLDSLIIGEIRVSQLLAAIFFISFLAVFYFRRKKSYNISNK